MTEEFLEDVNSLINTYPALEWKNIDKAKKLLERNTKNDELDHLKYLIKIFKDKTSKILSSIKEDQHFLYFWLYNYLIELKDEEKNAKKIINEEKQKKKEKQKQDKLVKKILELEDKEKNKILFTQLNRYSINKLFIEKWIIIENIYYISKEHLPDHISFIDITILQDLLFEIIFNNRIEIIKNLFQLGRTLKKLTILNLEKISFEEYLKCKSKLLTWNN